MVYRAIEDVVGRFAKMVTNREEYCSSLQYPEVSPATPYLADPASRSFGKVDGLPVLSFTELLGRYCYYNWPFVAPCRALAIPRTLIHSL